MWVDIQLWHTFFAAKCNSGHLVMRDKNFNVCQPHLCPSRALLTHVSLNRSKCGVWRKSKNLKRHKSHNFEYLIHFLHMTVVICLRQVWIPLFVNLSSAPQRALFTYVSLTTSILASQEELSFLKIHYSCNFVLLIVLVW